MGICSSKEEKKTGSQFHKEEKRLGRTEAKQSTSTSAKANISSEKRNPTVSKTGHVLGTNKPASPGESPDKTTGLSAKELAAKAAEERMAQKAQKETSGQLGKKLAEQQKKSRTQLGVEGYHEKKQTGELR